MAHEIFKKSAEIFLFFWFMALKLVTHYGAEIQLHTTAHKIRFFFRILAHKLFALRR